jgi:hypothetical protein
MKTFESLRMKRLKHGIPLTLVSERMGCSYSWTRQLEAGNGRTLHAQEWAKRYCAALDELIEERQAGKR